VTLQLVQKKEVDLCTKNTKFKVETWMQKDFPHELADFIPIDTPGFGSFTDDNKMIDEMVNVLKEEVRNVTAILLTFKGDDENFSVESVEHMIRELESLFGSTIWDHTALVSTFWHYDEQSIDERKKKGIDETWWTTEMNQALQERFIHLQKDLPSFFIDAWCDFDDPMQRDIFFNETDKLWNYIQNHATFDFKTVEDVLDDYYECMRTVEEDIAEIKEELLVVQQNFTKMDEKFDYVESEVIANKMQSDIADDQLRNDLTDVTLEIQQNFTAVGKQIDNNKEDIEEKLECAISDSWQNDTYVIGLLEGEISDRETRDQTIQSDINQIKSDINNINDDITDNTDRINAIKNKPRFVAEKRSGGYLPKGYITDFTELDNFGDIFNSTTGRLTINDEQQEGKYVLQVSAYRTQSHGKMGYIRVEKNQERVQDIYETDEGNDLMMNAVSALHLQKGDEVELYNYFNESIYVCSHNPFTFTGYKI